MEPKVFNTHEAKTHLSRLIQQAEEGDDVILARHGRPVAKLIPWPPARPTRTSGSWKGQVTYHDDIVGPDQDVADRFSDL